MRCWEHVDDKAQSMPSVALRRLSRLCRDSMANGIKARLQVCFSLPVKTKFSSLPGKKSSSPLAAKVSKRLAIWLLQINNSHPRNGPSLTEGLLERIPMPFPSPRLQWDALVWIPNQNTGEAMGGRERDLIDHPCSQLSCCLMGCS